MTQPDVRVSVQDFGPIVEATVDLRPLTVFVGPSNTGKTYLATLIYALHRVSHGLGRMPPRADFITEHLRGLDPRAVELAIEDARKKLLRVGRPFTTKDLPGQVRAAFPRMLGPVVGELEAELERCFDVESCSELIRSEGSGETLRVSLELREAERSLWQVQMDVWRRRELEGQGGIDDVVLVPAEASFAERGALAAERRKARGCCSKTSSNAPAVRAGNRVLATCLPRGAAWCRATASSQARSSRVRLGGLRNGPRSCRRCPG